MKRKNVIFISILIIVIIVGIIISFKSRETTEKISKEDKIDYKFYMGENVMYFEVSIEDELSGQAMYKEPVKIENVNIIKELEKIINSGIEHDFNGAFGLDMPPYANFYLDNGDKVQVVALDDFGMQGEESGNYILVTINDDSDNKKTYKVDEKLGEYFTNLYDERLLTD